MITAHDAMQLVKFAQTSLGDQGDEDLNEIQNRIVERSTWGESQTYYINKAFNDSDRVK